MPTRPKAFRPRGLPPRTKADRDADADRFRGSAASRGYDSRWAKARAAHLAANPLCAYCAAGAWSDPPRVVAASLVDHLYPHRGDVDLFWSTQWWASCCAPCHNGPKQAAERVGRPALDALARLLNLPTLPRPLGG